LPVIAGMYATAIDIHNPSLGGNAVTLWKRAVIAQPESAGQGSAPSSPFVTYVLNSGYAVEVVRTSGRC
jgi:hypothetical protein